MERRNEQSTVVAAEGLALSRVRRDKLGRKEEEKKGSDTQFFSPSLFFFPLQLEVSLFSSTTESAYGSLLASSLTSPACLALSCSHPPPASDLESTYTDDELDQSITEGSEA